MDGQSLSIKAYLKDWDTDNLFSTLYPDGDFEYVYKFQSQIKKKLDAAYKEKQQRE